jgi:hypothetical protein
MCCLHVRVSSMNTDNTFNNLIAATFTQINDQVFCNILETGIDPGKAYEIAYVDIPFGEDTIELYNFNQSEDFDDAILIDL